MGIGIGIKIYRKCLERICVIKKTQLTVVMSLLVFYLLISVFSLALNFLQVKRKSHSFFSLRGFNNFDYEVTSVQGWRRLAIILF